MTTLDPIFSIVEFLTVEYKLGSYILYTANVLPIHIIGIFSMPILVLYPA